MPIPRKLLGIFYAFVLPVLLTACSVKYLLS